MTARIQRSILVLAGWLMGFAALAPAQELLYTDSFNGPAGTRPQNWDIYGATGPSFWFIQDGQFNTGNGDNFDPGYTWAIVNTPGAENWSDYSISVDFWMPQEVGRVCLAIRWKDSGNFYYANLLASKFNQKVEISKYVNGQTPADPMVEAESPSQIQLPKFNQAGGAAESHRFEFRAVGNQLTVFLDGKEVLSAVDSTFRTGSAGVGQWYNQAYFDNVVLTGISESGVAAVTGGAPTAPPAGAGPVTPGVYRLLLAFQLTEAEANDLASALSDFPNVESARTSDGRYSVYLGRYATQDEARREMNRYQTEHGLVPQDVEFVPDAGGRATGGERNRVLVAEGVDRRSAEDLRGELMNLGFVPVDTEEGPGGYRVYAGPAFPAASDAEQMAEELRGAGFLMAEVRTVERSAASNLGPEDLGVGATDEERRKAQIFLQGIQDVEAGVTSYEGMKEQREKDQLLTEEVRKMLAQAEEKRRQEQARDLKVNEIIAEIEVYQSQSAWDQALAKLEELKRLRPEHPLIPIKDQSIRNQRDREQTGQQSPEARFASLQQQARQDEQRGNLEQALSIWEQVKTESREGPFYEEARRNIVRLQEAIASRGGAAGDGEGESSLVLYIIIGAVATLAIMFVIVLAMIMSKNRKRDEELLRQVQELTHTKDKGKSKSAGATKKTDKKAAPSEATAPSAAKSTPAPAPVPTSSISDSDRIRPGTISPAPEGSKTAPAAAKAPKAPAPSEVAKAEEEGLKLDFLFGDEKADEQAAPARDSSNQSSTEFVVPPPPEQAPGKAPKGAEAVTAARAPQPAAAAQDTSIVYYQNFEDEESGKTPKNWRGHYDYANLVVANGGHGNGSSKCLRFEKKSGIGSAYYSCRFPDAQGRVGVEFDLRCDDKNKYLLGFYIEKDEDFRQSVHTIVHRTNSSSNPTLRIQGEPTPYEFGKWCHVKFEIDLPRHLIDGFVDGEAIATGVRLNACPKVINTLSIRDNLATTGILLIDNIKIYKA